MASNVSALATSLTTPCFLQSSLCNLLLFGRLDNVAQVKIADSMWERVVPAGEILIQEGEVGLAATELYVVKEGKFEVRAEQQPGLGPQWPCPLTKRSAWVWRACAWAHQPRQPVWLISCLMPAAGPGAPEGGQHARQRQGARGRVWRGVPDVQLPSHGHRCRHYRRGGLGA